MAKTTGPSTEGYALFGDADALATVDGRLRQLEAEHFGQELLAAEADAVGDKATAEQHRKTAAEVGRRMASTSAIRDRIKAAADAATPPDADGDTAPTTT